MSNLRNTHFLRLLPDSLKQDPDAIAAAQALDKNQLYKEDFNKTLVLFNPETLKDRDSVLLDHLFRQEHVDVVSVDLTPEQKAELIFNSPAIHMKKGTAWAVQQVVSSVIAKAKIVEWFDYEGDPYKFRVEIETDKVEKGDIGRLHSVVNTVKNLRSSMESVHIIVGNSKIDLNAISYDVPVPYILTNTFTTESVAGGVARAEIFLKDSSYQISVPYSLTNQFYPEGNNLNTSVTVDMNINTPVWYSKLQRLNEEMRVGEVTL